MYLEFNCRNESCDNGVEMPGTYCESCRSLPKKIKLFAVAITLLFIVIPFIFVVYKIFSIPIGF